jgi:serine/threonine-protein phosphatase 2A regulatory subunit B
MVESFNVSKTSSGEPLWYLAHSLGDLSTPTEVDESDLISVIKFDRRGDYIAVGDKGGRIIVFSLVIEGSKAEQAFPKLEYLTEF